jgi:glyoxylase-like metal-dependent hydrolase (beta-lactamase superfamily II)
VFAFALRHPTGLVLFETGIGRGNEFLDDYYQVRQRPIEFALEAYGHRVDDVRLIVNSHLHFDHCGNNSRFPGVPIYVQAAEYQAAREPNYTVPEWVDFDGADYAVVDGDVQVASGVRVLSTPGHTPGHQSLVIDTEMGPLHSPVRRSTPGRSTSTSERRVPFLRTTLRQIRRGIWHQRRG